MEYLSPEMINGINYDFWIDNWAIGILTYELLVGVPPFKSHKWSLGMKPIKFLKPEFPSFITKTAENFILGFLKLDPKERMTV